MGDKAYITPAVLRWARESARIDLETAAGKVPVSAARLQEWENGSEQPTIRQAQILAKAYRRPFALLFLPKSPTDFQPLQDFRRTRAKPLSTASIFMIREMQQKQAWTRDRLEEEELLQLPFVGRFSLGSNPKDIADDILKELEIDPINYQRRTPISEWLEKTEAKGVFVSRTSFINTSQKIDPDEVQGFVIADPLAPFIFINSGDWNAPQLFTLVHELAHIWIARSGISNEINMESDADASFDPVEIFCNQIAGHALMPNRLMNDLSASIFESAESIYKQARKIGVSSAALLVRAVRMNILSKSRYDRLKKESDNAFQDFLVQEAQKKAALKVKESHPGYYMLLTLKNGRLFTRLVMDSYRGGFIQPTEASALLNTSTNNFSKLEAFVHS